MPIDREAALALELSAFTVEVERGALRQFAAATGESRAEYVDVAAARASGHRDLPVPPTYFFSLELLGPSPFDYLEDLGVDLRTVLHGGQHFSYRMMAYAGDELRLQPRIVDVVSKRGGAMELITRRTEVVDTAGAPVAHLESVLVVQELV